MLTMDKVQKQGDCGSNLYTVKTPWYWTILISDILYSSLFHHLTEF